MQGSDGELWSLQDGMGSVNGPLVLSLLAQWVLVFFCIYNLTKTVQVRFPESKEKKETMREKKDDTMIPTFQKQC